MKELIRTTFESGKLPEGWMEQNRVYSFEKEALRCGRAMNVKFFIPGEGWNRLRVELEVEATPGAALTCGDGTYIMSVDLARHTQSIGRAMGSLARSRREFPSPVKRRKVAFEFDHGLMRIEIDGNEVLSARDPHPTATSGLLELGFWDDCLIYRVTVAGDDPVILPFVSEPVCGRDFHLEVTVDFLDDLLYAPWTEKSFDDLFAEFKSWGVKRCHWIYYGNSREGWWDLISVVARNAAITMQNVGEIFPAAVRAAHAHGIEIYGLFKPFDMGIYYNDGEGRTKLLRIGGGVSCIADFPARHRELLMRRKPGNFGPGNTEPFTRIDIVKDDAEKAAFAVENVRIFVSDDNITYLPYEGPISREEVVEDYAIWEHTSSGGRPTGEMRKARVMRFRDLNIGQRYVALSVEGRDRSFSNSYINLIHVFNERGEERMLTHGVQTRIIKYEATSAAGISGVASDFRKTGVDFDVTPGFCSAIFPGYDFIREPWAFDSKDGILAIARGKDSGPIAVLSPSFAETREWWLSWLRECLDAGADGIEVRMRSHNFCFAWGEYGFESPVRDEFLKRYGIDLWETDDFDKAAWRRLRGEGYTEFCRQAKKLAKDYGKPFGLHISPTLNMEPEEGGAMDMHWDWRTWLDEGLPDTITMKEVWPGSRFANEIFRHTRPRKISTVFSPFGLQVWGAPNGEKVVENWIKFARDYGCNGYQYYECAAIIKGRKEGGIAMEQPALREVFKRNFR